MRLIRILGAGLALGTLAGCAVPAAVTIASYAADGASLLTTGRSISDHGLSILLREDCALFRAVKGTPVCRPMQTTDPVYALAFAPRRFDYPDPEGADPSPRPSVTVYHVRNPPRHRTVTPAAPVQLAAIAPPAPSTPSSLPPPAARIASAAPPPSTAPTARPRPVPPPKPHAHAHASAPTRSAALPAGYRVIAGAFNQREGAAERQQVVKAQLRHLGYPDLDVFVVRMPAGSPAAYVVLTPPLEERRADVLLGQLQLGRGDSPWKMQSDPPTL